MKKQIVCCTAAIFLAAGGLGALPAGTLGTAIADFAFEGTDLTSVTIPDTVTSIGWEAFRYCRSLKSVTIPDSVTEFGWEAFKGCSSLKSVTLPDSVKTISAEMFMDCGSLESVTIPLHYKKTEIKNQRKYKAFSPCTRKDHIGGDADMVIFSSCLNY